MSRRALTWIQHHGKIVVTKGYPAIHFTFFAAKSQIKARALIIALQQKT